MVEAGVQRSNMVESQVLPSDVTDRRILRSMRTLPRERFVPASMAAIAYMDGPVLLTPPGSERRWLLAPRVQAKLLQLADIGEAARVLDVGCGSGYSAAVLAGMARTVVALECDATLAETARRNLEALGLAGVTVAEGALPDGWPGEAPYDAIIVEGAIAAAPQRLLDQLKDGGRLVAIMEEGELGKATIWRRLGRSLDAWEAFDATAAVLPGFAAAPAFVL